MGKFELVNELEIGKKEIKSYLEISFKTQNQLTLTPTCESHRICTFSKITSHLSGKNLIKYHVENYTGILKSLFKCQIKTHF